ncbi:MAG: hypothetical protein MUO72_09545 [Bacteroidales bacterium]|nr:hypothetical protein [Bacteroidales bacterium]
MILTTLFKLKAGDRFYFVGDKKKKVYEVNHLTYKRIFSKAPQFVVFTDHTEKHQDREVVLLRNVNK